MRRIVTATNSKGKSYFLHDEVMPDGGIKELWRTTAEQPLGFDPPPGPFQLLPPHGDIALRVVGIPPDSAKPDWSKDGIPPPDNDGFHVTESVDYVMILEGKLTLVLDEGETEMGPGDIVVQRQTSHAWRNKSDRTVRMLAVMVRI